jgi:hypothetical protein
VAPATDEVTFRHLSFNLVEPPPTGDRTGDIDQFGFLGTMIPVHQQRVERSPAVRTWTIFLQIRHFPAQDRTACAATIGNTAHPAADNMGGVTLARVPVHPYDPGSSPSPVTSDAYQVTFTDLEKKFFNAASSVDKGADVKDLNFIRPMIKVHRLRTKRPRAIAAQARLQSTNDRL